MNPKGMGAIGLGADLCRESRHHASLLLEIANDVEPSDTTCVIRSGFQRGQQPKMVVGDMASEDRTPPRDFDNICAFSRVGVLAPSALRPR